MGEEPFQASAALSNTSTIGYLPSKLNSDGRSLHVVKSFLWLAAASAAVKHKRDEDQTGMNLSTETEGTVDRTQMPSSAHKQIRSVAEVTRQSRLTLLHALQKA